MQWTGAVYALSRLLMTIFVRTAGLKVPPTHISNYTV